MASQVWPASLPQEPLVNSYEEQPPKTAIHTEMDRGPAKSRRRSTAMPRPIQMRFLMDSSQLDTFDEFFGDTIKGGALKFDFDEPRTGTTKEFKMDRERPVYTPLGGGLFHVDVTMTLQP